MSIPPRVPSFVDGVRRSRQARGDGTLGGRVRSATPYGDRPVGGRQQTATLAVGPSTRVDTLTLTANSQQIATTADDIVYHNELVGLTPRAGFADYGGTPTDTIVMPMDGRLLTNLTLLRSTATAWTVRWHVTRGSQTLIYDMPAGSSTDPAIAEAPPLTVKAGDVLRTRIIQSSGGDETLDGATLHLTLIQVSPRSEPPEEPAELTLLGTVGMQNPKDVAVVGSYAYMISNSDSAFYVVDVTDPAAPVLLNTTTDASMSNPFGVDAEGNFAYVASFSSDALTVFDVTDPNAPSVAGSVSSADLDGARYVSVDGNYAYVTAGTSDKLVVVDVSTPSAPAIVGTLDLAGDAYGVAAAAPYVYVTASGVLYVVDVSTPSAPTIVGTLGDGPEGTLGSIKNLSVGTSHVYIAHHGGISQDDDSLKVVDVSDPTDPTLVADLTSANLWKPEETTVAGSYVYMTGVDSDSLLTIDVSDPTAPVEVDAYVDGTGLNGPHGVFAANGYVYVAVLGTDVLAIFEFA